MTVFRGSGEGGDSRLFVVKAFLLVLGASIGIAGMVTGNNILVVAAIVIVAVGMVLRVLDRRRKDSEPESD